ncbi:MAG: helix-turn-helix domain-containing protein [Bacteroidales bacterium]|nr:helix-turn-helix domain-containing protein [Candidatus Colimorpha onthohippi]
MTIQPPPPAPVWDWIYTAEVMSQLHVSYNTVLNLINRGILPPSHIGRKLFFRKSDINNILNQNILCENGSIDSTGWITQQTTTNHNEPQ